MPISTVLAPLGCGVLTGFGSMWNVLDPGDGDIVAVYGTGAVGLSAVIAASLRTSGTAHRDRHRRRAAARSRESSARRRRINAGTEDVAERLAEITGGRGVTPELRHHRASRRSPAVPSMRHRCEARCSCAAPRRPEPRSPSTSRASSPARSCAASRWATPIRSDAHPAPGRAARRGEAAAGEAREALHARRDRAAATTCTTA